MAEPDPSVVVKVEVGERGVAQQITQNVTVYAGAPTHVPSQAPSLTAPIVDRRETADILKTRLLARDPDAQPVLVITAIHGQGGIGKTTLAKALAHDAGVKARFPDGILWATLGQTPNVLHWLGEWIQVLGDHNYRPTLPQATSAHLHTLLVEKSVLLVIDDVWNAADAAPLLAGGPQCRVLITTRRHSVADGVGAEAVSLGVMTPEEALELIVLRLGHKVSHQEEHEAMALTRAVGYLPLALELAAARVRRGVPWATLTRDILSEVARLETLEGGRFLAKSEAGLEASFRLSLDALRADSEEAWQDFVHLGVLPEDAVIAAPMAATLWGLDEPEADELLERLWDEAMLIGGLTLWVRGSACRAYRLHDLWHDMARRLLCAPTPNGVGVSLPQAQERLLKRYQHRNEDGQWPTLAEDGYIHGHLLWHMEKAGQFGEIIALLKAETSEGRNAWYAARERLGQTAGYVQDLTFALELAEARAQEAVAENRSVETLGLEILLVLMLASLNSLAARISEELLVGLVREGVWTPAQGLAYSLRQRKAEKRTEMLLALREYLPEPERSQALRQALEVATGIGDDRDRSRALVGVAHHLSEPERGQALRQALEVAASIGGDVERSYALVAVAAALAGAGQVQQALEVATGIGDDFHRSRALQGVAAALAGAGQVQQALEAAASIGDDDPRSYALVGVAAALAGAGHEEQALEVATAIGDDHDRSYALAAVAAALAGAGQVQQALEATTAIEDASYRSDALRRVAAALAGAGHEEQALEVAASIGDDRDRSDALAEVAHHLSEPERGQALRQALEAATRIGGDVERSYALAAVAVALAGAGQVQQALEAATGIGDDFHRSDALVAVAHHLSEPERGQALRQALEVAASIGDDDPRSDALVAVAAALAGAGHEEQALEVATAIEDDSHRSEALAAVAHHLSEPERGQALRQALEVAASIGGDVERSYALAAVAVALAGAGQVQQALEVAASIGDDDPRSYALVGVAAALAGAGHEEQALEVATAIEDDSRRSEALVAVAVALAGAGHEEQALEVATAIGDDHDRSYALAVAAAALAGAGQVQQALEVATAIEDDSHRSDALVGVAAALARAGQVQQALEVATAIGDDHDRSYALAAVAAALAGAGQVQQALEVATAIGDDHDRSYALAAVAAALAGAGHEEQALVATIFIRTLLTQGRQECLGSHVINGLLMLVSSFGRNKALSDVSWAIQAVTRWWP